MIETQGVRASPPAADAHGRRDAIVIVPAAPERVRSNDSHYPYRQDSDFHYLAGFPEPDAVLALIPGREQGEMILFCRERDAERERWDGARAGTEGAVADYGMDDAFPIDDIDDILPGMIEGRARVYYHFGRDPEFDLKLIGWVNRVRAEVRKGARAAARVRRAVASAARPAPVQVAQRAARDARSRRRSPPPRTCARCARRGPA